MNIVYSYWFPGWFGLLVFLGGMGVGGAAASFRERAIKLELEMRRRRMLQEPDEQSVSP